MAECEIMLDDQGWDIENRKYPVLYDGEKQIPVQLVRESSDVPLDWRKKIAFNATAGAFSVKRYKCFFVKDNKLRPVHDGQGEGDYVLLKGKNSVVKINRNTGLIDSFRISGKEYLKEGSAKINIISNCFDPWGFEFNSFKEKTGEFRIMTAQETADFLKTDPKEVSKVKIIEDGPIKTVAECYFIHGFSRVRVCYGVNKEDDVLDIKIDLFNAEKDCKVKIAFAGVEKDAVAEGKSMFCRYVIDADGDERAVQDYTVLSKDGYSLSVMSFGTYGLDYKDGTLGCTMLSGCAYSAEPILDRKVVPSDRFTYRMDQGERNFRFALTGGRTEYIKENAERISLTLRQPLQSINFFPVNEKKEDFPLVNLSHPASVTECFKAEENGNYTVRVYNSDETPVDTALTVGKFAANKKIHLNGYQFKTFVISAEGITETDAMGEKTGEKTDVKEKL